MTLAKPLQTLAMAVICCSATTVAQEISWVPVGADGPFTTSLPDDVGEPTRITLEGGTEYRVEFEIRANGWGDAPGIPTLGTYQATLDARGLLGANADPPNPGVDFQQINAPPYGAYTGCFIKLRTCHNRETHESTGRRCDHMILGVPCPSWEYCADNPDFVFAEILAASAVSVATPNFSYGAATYAGACKTDEGIGYYLGTFIFDVPAEAKGVYEFGFDMAVAATFLNNCAGVRIPDVTLTPGSVALTTGACCSPTPVEEDRCQSHVARTECDGPMQTYFHGESCEDPLFSCPPSPITTLEVTDENAKRSPP